MSAIVMSVVHICQNRSDLCWRFVFAFLKALQIAPEQSGFFPISFVTFRCVTKRE